MRTSSLLVLASTLLVGSSGCYYVGVDLPDLRAEVRSTALTFSEPAEAVGHRQTLSATVEVNILDEFSEDLGDLLTRAEVRELALTPAEGITNFEFIEHVDVRLEADGLPPLTLSEDRKDLERDADGRLIIPIEPDLNAAEYIKQPARFQIEVDCVVPAPEWGARLDIHLDVRAETWQQVL